MDGSILHERAIESSGHQLLAIRASRLLREMRFDSPGTLDGKPVRVMLALPVCLKLQSPGIGLPPTFSDSFLLDLGSRLLRAHNAGDADSVFANLDEAAKREVPPEALQSITRGCKMWKEEANFYCMGCCTH